MFQLGFHSINLAGWGCPKREAAMQWEGVGGEGEMHAPQVHMFGQDAMGYYKWTTKTGVDMLAISIADGHGDKAGGRQYANQAIMLGLPMIRKNAEAILDSATSSTADDTTQLLMNQIFTELDMTITRQEWRHSGMGSGSPMLGGSTLTVQILFPHPKMPEKLMSVVSNMGDSPMMAIGEAGVTEKTFSLNSDTLEAYQYYLDTVPVDQIPEEIYLGRFNMTTWGSYKLPYLGIPQIDEFGVEMAALRPFNLEIVDGRWTASVRNDAMQDLFEKSPKGMMKQIQDGGVQTRRDCASFLKAKELAEAGLGDYPTWNFGNTNCNGTIQCLRGSGIGDISHKIPFGCGGWDWVFDDSAYPKTLSKTMVECINPEDTLVMGSDGFFDVMTDEDLIASIHSDSPTTLGALISTMYEQAKEDLRFKNCFTPTGHQCWDDISIWTIKIKTIVPEPAEDLPEAGQYWCLHPECKHDLVGFTCRSDLSIHLETHM